MTDAGDSRKGRLTIEGHTATLVFERILHHAPELVWEAIATPEGRGFLPGLHAFLDRLEAQLDDEPLPDWTGRFNELLGQYPEWPKHATPPAE